MEDEKQTVKKVTLIRHAESEMNLRPDVICGHALDCNLSKSGRKEAENCGLALKGIWQPKVVYVTPAKRTQQTASLLWPEAKQVIEDSFLEQNLGDFEMKNREMTYTQEILDQMKKEHIDYRPPNGESIRDVGIRAMKRLKNLLVDYDEIVIVTHGNTIRSVIQAAMQSNERMTWKLGCQNLRETVLHYDAGHWILVRMNAHPVF
jgi:broad specificity phosphatase PhoE